MGKTTVTAAMAREPIHCPTKIVSIKILTDMNRTPIEDGTACFISSFLISWLPKSSAVTAIYAFIFSALGLIDEEVFDHVVIQLPTV